MCSGGSQAGGNAFRVGQALGLFSFRMRPFRVMGDQLLTVQSLSHGFLALSLSKKRFRPKASELTAYPARRGHSSREREGRGIALYGIRDWAAMKGGILK